MARKPIPRRKPTPEFPTIVLTESMRVGPRDARNFTIYTRTPSGWKPNGFYSSLTSALEAAARKHLDAALNHIECIAIRNTRAAYDKHLAMAVEELQRARFEMLSRASLVRVGGEDEEE